MLLHRVYIAPLFGPSCLLGACPRGRQQQWAARDGETAPHPRPSGRTYGSIDVMQHAWLPWSTFGEAVEASHGRPIFEFWGRCHAEVNECDVNRTGIPLTLASNT